MRPRTADPRTTLGYRSELWGREATFPDLAETPDFWSTIRWISGRGEPVAIRVPSHVAASRCLISLGVARTHEFFRVGLGLTNLTGLVHREDRGSVGWRSDPSIAFLPVVARLLGMVQPWRGWLVRAWLSMRSVAGGMRPTRRERLMLDVVERATDRLVELAGLLLPRFSLIDGFSGMQGEGPRYGSRVPLGTVIAGNDAVAVDAVAASLMGFEPMEIGYLRQAQAMGLGTADLSAITVVGDPMSQLRRRFRRHAHRPALASGTQPWFAVRQAGSPRPHFGAVPSPGQRCRSSLGLPILKLPSLATGHRNLGPSGRAAMRIGFDGTCLANRRGFGRFSRLLLEALASANHSHQLVVVIDAPSEPTATIPESLERLVVKVSQAPAAAASSKGRRGFRDMLAMGRAVAAAGLDLMYFPATYTFFPVWNVPRLVVTMHDTLALAHPGLVFPTRRGRLAWLLKEHAAARWADQIVTVSETSRRDLQRWFRLPDHKLRTITEGPDPIFVPRVSDHSTDEVLRKYAIRPGARYLLYVGGLSPHKNLPRLIEAFSRVTSDDVSLVLVGDLNDVFHTARSDDPRRHRQGKPGAPGRAHRVRP